MVTLPIRTFDIGPRGPQQMIRRRFTVQDLVADARSDTDKAPERTLGQYLRVLRAAGYVAEAPRRIKGASLTSNGFKIWCLVRNTGPKAPIACPSSAAVHDPNTGEDVPCAPR
jgi:hypothetical protein